MVTSAFIRCVFIAVVYLFAIGTNVYPGEKQVVGWVEKIRIVPGDLSIKAKLDTGALNSSLHANRIEVFEHQGEKWVRFDLTNWQNRKATFEKKVIRTARIKEHDRESARRWVINLGLCLSDIYKEAEVNLADRSHFKYRMLVGRSFLRNAFVVDPALMFTRDPQCRGDQIRE